MSAADRTAKCGRLVCTGNDGRRGEILLAQDGEFASHAAASVRSEDPFDTSLSARLWRSCYGRLDMPADLLRPIPGELRLLSFWHDDDPEPERASRGEQDPASAVPPACLLTMSVLVRSRQTDPGTKADWNDRDAGAIVEVTLRPRLVLQPEHESIGCDLAAASIMPIAAHAVEAIAQAVRASDEALRVLGLTAGLEFNWYPVHMVCDELRCDAALEHVRRAFELGMTDIEGDGRPYPNLDGLQFHFPGAG
ncbi:hypothetical protein GQY15_21145 [Rhodobacter sphaeroides]|uniref:hypothetical protein n=1 Tax=Cereibacter sphaeroides TaxID=1063 RepID=UPI0013263770|nr:hypothetical protein [Cereibacter sphaeroides]MWP40065.1 hypothetical protein [Cereibacter sphaeroides]